MRLIALIALLVLTGMPLTGQAQESDNFRWVESWGTALPLQPPPPSPFGGAPPPPPEPDLASRPASTPQ